MADDKRTFAYICPECKQLVVAQRTAFSIAAGDCDIPCPCGKSSLSVENLGSMYHLSVPCVACGRNHEVSCPQEALLRRKALALTCKATGFDSCVIGEEAAVYEAARRMEHSADELPENTENGKEGFLNPLVMQEVLSEIKEIAARDGISCTCGSHRWSLDVRYASVVLRCGDCGGVLKIPAGTAEDIENICCQYTLKIKGRR